MVKLARASAVNFAVNNIETIIGAIATLYFARVLGAGPMGSYFLALGLINWLLIPSSGINTAVLKRVSEDWDQDWFFSAGLSLQLGYLLIVVGCILFFANRVNEYIGFDGAILVGGGIACLGLARLLNIVLRGKNRVELASILEGLRNIARILSQVALVVIFGLGLTGLLIGEVLAAIGISIVLVVILKPKAVLPARRHFTQLYEYGKYSWFGSLKVNAYSWTDTLVLGLFVSVTVVGTYEIAWRISALFILLPAAFGSTIFPTISKHAQNENFEPIRQIIERTVPLAPALAIPGAVGAIVIGSEVLAIYGPEFTSGALFLFVLSVARILEAIEQLLEQVLNALDYPERTFRVAVVFIIINTGLNFGLILAVGAIGAAVATCISTLVSFALAWHLLPNEVTPPVPLRTISVEVASASVMGIIVHFVSTIFTPQTIFEVTIYVGGGAMIYIVGLLLGSPLARDVFEQLISESIR